MPKVADADVSGTASDVPVTPLSKDVSYSRGGVVFVSSYAVKAAEDPRDEDEDIRRYVSHLWENEWSDDE